MTGKTGITAALALLGLSYGAEAQQIEFARVGNEVLEARLRDCPFGNGKRHRKLLEVFEDAGCSAEQLTEQKVKRSRYPNIICTLPGETDNIILVGAHYDAAYRSKGVADNWSGAMLLPTLYQALKTRPRKHTLVFVGFTAEEEGLIGSKAYAKNLSPEERDKIRAMVNLDTLGLAPPAVWMSQADPRLVTALDTLAGSLRQTVNATNVDEVGNSDSKSFADIGVPTITFHSLTPDTLRFIHNHLDQIDKIQWDDYFQSCRLVTAFLAYVDVGLQ